MDPAQCLAEKWPDAVREADSAGMLPIHHAASEGSPPLVGYLVELWAPSVRKTDKKGRLPIHHACVHASHLYSHNEPLEQIRCLLEEWPGSIRVQDDDGYLPLHHLMTMHVSDQMPPTLPFLVDRWPDRFE
jgi:ankyrin repeat protein